jgi:hypothetical protein
MSPISRAGFVAIAVPLALGAVQFASGYDLTGGLAAGLVTTASAAPETGINRTAKADRMKADRTTRVAMPSAPTRTISIRLDGLADTSVVIRIPMVRESRNIPLVPLLTKPADRRLTLACEPVVSALTEVAKRLQPGRCVT